jgi:hypothetical protein
MLNIGAYLIANSFLNHSLKQSDSKINQQIQTDLANLNHQNRLQELKQQQELGHQYRSNEQLQASWLRCREIALTKQMEAQTQQTAHLNRLNEIEWSAELQLHRDLYLRQITQENSLELEQIRSQYSIQTAAINRSSIKWGENSPFLEPLEQNIQILKETYNNNQKPLVLIAPFWDDTRTHGANDQGGFPDFRVAINAAWQQAKWFDGVIKCDGYIKRPLRYTDRDIAVITAELADIPVILIHGMVQAGQRVHPAITIWNILPNQANNSFQLELESFDVKPKQTGSLEFQDYVAQYLSTIVGILSDAHQLFLTGKRPDLRRYVENDTEKLKLLAAQFSFYYDLVCYQDPMNEHVYRLDNAQLLNECGLLKEAEQQLFYSMSSLCHQKQNLVENNYPQKDIIQLIEYCDSNDKEFLLNFVATYQAIKKADDLDAIYKKINTLPAAEPKLGNTISSHIENKEKNIMNFTETKQKALSIINDLREIGKGSTRDTLKQSDGKYQTDISNVEEQINTQRFIVGVVGVFNTGKSMLLNALLRQELLSTEIIPETAAITSLNYNDTANASVHYWTKDEWEAIETQGASLDEGSKQSTITKMVNDTKSKLESQFTQVITDTGRVEKIPLDELKEYTSANSDKGYAPLVREVEIGINMDFLIDNIKIVDTPGLNDPVQLREHITLDKFLPSCDLLLWLLPAKMAFTEYEKKFLEAQLKRKQLHKLFVIINQIDTFRKQRRQSEVEKIINWVRGLIQEIYEECSKDNNSAKAVSENIEIFPLSAEESMLNRTGQHQDASMSDEESGVPAFENRLRKFLFEGERAVTIQLAIQQRLSGIVTTQIGQIEEQLSHLDEPLDKFQQLIAQAQQEHGVVETKLKRIEMDIDKELRHFKDNYTTQIDVMARSIKDIKNDIISEVDKKIEEFLGKNVYSVMKEGDKWAKKDLQPFIQQKVKEKTEDIVQDTEKRINQLIEDFLETSIGIYKVALNEIDFSLPNINASNGYASIFGHTALGLGTGLALTLGLGILSSHGAAIVLSSLYTGPLALIIAPVTLVAMWMGAARAKDKIRLEMKSKLPAELSNSIEKVAKKAEQGFMDKRQDLIKKLKEIVAEPAQEIEKQLRERKNNLNQLLKERESKEFDIEQKRQDLTQEKSKFESVEKNINELI